MNPGQQVQAVSCTPKHTKNPCDLDLEILWVSRGCEGTCSCKISSKVQQLTSYCIIRKKLSDDAESNTPSASAVNNNVHCSDNNIFYQTVIFVKQSIFRKYAASKSKSAESGLLGIRPRCKMTTSIKAVNNNSQTLHSDKYLIFYLILPIWLDQLSMVHSYSRAIRT